MRHRDRMGRGSWDSWGRGQSESSGGLRLAAAWWLPLALILGCVPGARGDEPDPEAVARGRAALLGKGYLKAGWGLDAYTGAGRLWGAEDRDPGAYADAFNRHYGLHPAPYPNDGLPMGLRRAPSRDGSKKGLQIDCLICHGGSIGGTSYVGLGNSQLDLKGLFDDLDRSQGRTPPPSLFTLNSARGTVNAGQVSVVLWSFRNADLSIRPFPLLFGANIPELDVPPWWILKKKETQYYDGRTDARSARSNMQFLLAEATLDRFQELESTFRDIMAYIKSIEAPKYPFPIDRATADRGRVVFEETCARCHGTYGPDGDYPNRVVPLDVIGTDPARARGLSPRFVAHYNATWFAENYPVNTEMTGYQAPPLDGIWASAPYLHNGSVPTLYNLLKSSSRPGRFRRPPSTDFAHYDREHVGWTFEVVPEPPDPKLPAHEAKFIYDTSRFGLGNRGHTFGDKLTEEERLAVIEYLKTL